MNENDVVGWTRLEITPGERIYVIDKGFRGIQPEVREWLISQGISSNSVGFRFRMSPSRATVWFEDPNHAMLFKLAWGGNL